MFRTEENAKSHAESLNFFEDEGWTYKAVEAPNGWVVEAYDEDGHFCGLI